MALVEALVQEFAHPGGKQLVAEAIKDFIQEAMNDEALRVLQWNPA
jgi:hypothetical protein